MKEAVHVEWACGSVDAIVRQLEQAISKVGLVALGTRDLREQLLAGHLALQAECQLVEVGNPTMVGDLLGADMSLSAVFPCRVAVYQASGKVGVAVLRPTAVLEALGKVQLLPAATSLENALLGAIVSVCGWSRRSEALGSWNMC
jgi:uncharacterized protein (DUF302 family)